MGSNISDTDKRCSREKSNYCDSPLLEKKSSRMCTSGQVDFVEKERALNW